MKGTMITIPVAALDAAPVTVELTATPALDALQEGVGGYIEAVPYFSTVLHAGAIQKCVAFCNEEGKLKGLPINRRATLLWDEALKRENGKGLRDAGGRFSDVLCGSIVVLFGDDEFLEAL